PFSSFTCRILRHKILLTLSETQMSPLLRQSLLSLFALLAAGAVASPARATENPSAFVKNYCTGCHNQRTKTANLTLDTADIQNVGEDPALWERVIKKLRVRAMPPAGARRPGADEYATFIASIEQGLDHAAAAAPNPGRVPIHRLNRLQY